MAAQPFPDSSSFRQRFMQGHRLLGTFVKTPAPQPIEILGTVGFDFVVIDEEHAPFDRAQIDIALLAARASGVAGLVRVSSPDTILGALDCGAAGVLVPHVSDAIKARAVVEACRYRKGRRGYSPSGRSGRYGGFASWPYVDDADETVTAIAMIEDPSALEAIEEISAVEGIDGFFVGRGDLTIALGAADARAPEIDAAVTRIAAAAQRAGKPVMVMASARAEGDAFSAMGATAFILSTDQGLLRKAAGHILRDFRD
ncbi:aldolase/citrate lyase family protein [Aureimonas sp. ME7]|uniref:HpcH/HpaI aldolase family protein n=1 Tax=Aureimonas sp. ME7 TaxID=2744252 RepID=UPI0015F8D7C6|nr:aldolase/citrate lyase family protein [Aureimonas sp. ME7]